MDTYILGIINYMSLSIGHWLCLCMMLLCFLCILILWKIWEEKGLYLYNAVAVVCANIQALKVAPCFLAEEALPLATILFATTFTASDILTERKGVSAAILGVKLSFAAQIMVTLFMLIAVAYPVESGLAGENEFGTIINPVQYSMHHLFIPSVRLLVASLTAYYLSQMLDIYLFKAIKNLTKHKFLWLRFNVSNICSGLVDNAIFSVLAWVLLSDAPVSTNMLIYVYVLGSYGFRVVVNIASTPVIYYTRKK